MKEKSGRREELIERQVSGQSGVSVEEAQSLISSILITLLWASSFISLPAFYVDFCIFVSFLFPVTALLRCSFHTMSCLKCATQLFSAYSQFQSHHHHQCYNMFINIKKPPKPPVPISTHSSAYPCTLLPTLTYSLSLWICLFWTFHINGIIRCVIFCDGLLSLSIMFLRFIHVGACISTSFPFIAEHMFPYRYTTYYLSIHLLRDIWVVSTF